MPSNFFSRIKKQVQSRSSLCIGLDPSSEVLSAWNLDDDINGLSEFSATVIDLVEDHVGFIKPQVAFYERFGSAGFEILERTISMARSRGLFVIADAKRGDIGTTMAGYTAAWLREDSPLRSDALTVSSYLGVSSLFEAAKSAAASGAGLFALCATSNPEAKEIQQAKFENKMLPAQVLELAISCPTNNVGLVIGATKNLEQFGLASILEQEIEIPILAPGFGAQGAKLSDLEKIFGASASSVIPTVSRSVLLDGKDRLVSEVLKAKVEL